MTDEGFFCSPASAHRLWWHGDEVGVAIEVRKPKAGWYVVIDGSTDEPFTVRDLDEENGMVAYKVLIHPDLRTAAQYAWEWLHSRPA